MLLFRSKFITLSCAIIFGAGILFTQGLMVAKAATVTPRIELEGDRGQSVQVNVKIQNEEKQSKTFFISAENFDSQDETGSPHFTTRREDLATWIEAPENVTVGPGGSQDVPIKINIPDDAESGGHFAAIFFQTEPPNSPTRVSVSAKLGSLILLNVKGKFQEGASILEFSSVNRHHFFKALPITFYYRFQNGGGAYLKPLGDVLIKNTIGHLNKILAANPVDGGVLPKSVRRFETTWISNSGPKEQDVKLTVPEQPKGFWGNVAYEWKNFAFGRYEATLKIAYGNEQLKSANAHFSFFVIPWELLLVIILGTLLVLLVGRFFLRRYNRYIISQAQIQRKPKPKPKNHIKK